MKACTLVGNSSVKKALFLRRNTRHRSRRAGQPTGGVILLSWWCPRGAELLGGPPARPVHGTGFRYTLVHGTVHTHYCLFAIDSRTCLHRRALCVVPACLSLRHNPRACAARQNPQIPKSHARHDTVDTSCTPSEKEGRGMHLARGALRDSARTSHCACPIGWESAAGSTATCIRDLSLIHI